VDRVVGADQEIGPGLRQLVGRFQHQLRHGLQIAGVQRLLVAAEIGRVQGHFRVAMAAQHGRRLGADRAVAQGRALGGTTDDPDVQGHARPPVVARRWSQKNPGFRSGTAA